MDGKIASSGIASSSESELGQQLRRASKVARLELSEVEMQALLKDAQAILGKFSEIKGLDLSSTPIMEPGETQLREDGPREVSNCIEEILAQVPKKEGERLVKAPKSI